MKNKKINLKKKVVGSLILASTLSVSAIGSIGATSTKNEYTINKVNTTLNGFYSLSENDNLNSDYKWIESIKQSTNSNTIKLFFGNDSLMVYQQIMLAFQYMINSYEQNNFSDYEIYDDNIALFLNENLYNLNQFNLENLKSKKYVKLIKNLNDLNGDLNESYNNIPSNQMLEETLNYYLNKFKFSKNIKFDIWISDISLIEIWNNHYESFLNLLPHINEIYLLTNGNFQSLNFAINYIKRQKQNNYDLSEICNNLQELQNSDVNYETRKELYMSTNMYDYLLSDIFTIFHLIKYSDSPYYNIEQRKMYKAYRINYDYIDVASKLYDDESTLNKETSINAYRKSYENFFKINANSFECFIYSGYENYDPNKKNIIWIGDKLIEDIDNVDKKRKEEIQKTFYAMTKIYNPSEYNYLFKQHPSYNLETQEKLTNMIIELSDVKPIVFKDLPFELFLSWDKSESINRMDKQYRSFFSETSNNDLIPNTQLIGMQYTSSTILTTYNFLVNQYNMSLSDAWKTINSKNFPISGTFDILKQGKSSWKSYSSQVKKNINKINELYEPFVQLKVFPNYNENLQSASKFLDSQNIDFVAKNTNKSKIDLMICTSATGAFALIVGIPLLVFFIKKRKLNKLRNNGSN